ncbi:MAG: helix-turn-helix transcriptional regulator [Candidatus Aenigmatarchaeota archaeon]
MSRGYLKNLKKLRHQKGWSQEKLAKEAGISYQTLIKIERGYIKNPKLETLIKLAKALSVSVDKLIK